ncbi:MAG: hypothetical protein RIR26_1038 [Pseudomonadota bacterium]|jgi:hypothetical protein
MGSVERCFLSSKTSRVRVFCFLALPYCLFLSGLSQGDDSSPNFINTPVNVSCRGISDFDFVFQFGEMISEWCRKQNEILGEQGCGVGSEMCLEEMIRADRPAKALSFGVGASYVHANRHTTGKDVVAGEPYWLPTRTYFPDDGSYSFSNNSTFDRLQLVFSVGVEIPLGSRRILRKTCVNPYSSDYVSLMTKQVLDSNKTLQSFLNSCSF